MPIDVIHGIDAAYAWINYASMLVTGLILANMALLIFLISQARKNRESVIIKHRDDQIAELNDTIRIKEKTITRQLNQIGYYQNRYPKDVNSKTGKNNV